MYTLFLGHNWCQLCCWSAACNFKFRGAVVGWSVDNGSAWSYTQYAIAHWLADDVRQFNWKTFLCWSQYKNHNMGWSSHLRG